MKRETFSKFFLHQGLIILIVIYFAFHGYVVHFGSVPSGSLVLLSLVLIAVSLFLQRLFNLVFKNEGKATIYTAFLLLIILFFGVLQDMVSGQRAIATLGRLTIFFPFSIVFLITGFFLVRRSRSSFSRSRMFLTILMLIYLFVDLFSFARTNINGPAPENSGITDQVNTASTGKGKPSVYLILLDEYVGNEGLNSYYRYPNNAFRDKLAGHNFHITSNPSSNYQLTIYSMASLLNMELLPYAAPAVISNHYAYKQALQALDKNRTCEMFRGMGYRVINKSPFYFGGQAPAYSNGLLPDKMNLVQHQTMYYRVAKALPDIMAEKFGMRDIAERNAALADENNNLMMSEVLKQSATQYEAPSFTYLHLMMPHDPLVRDSMGNYLGLTNYGSAREAGEVDSAYLQYLVYSNNKIGHFIDTLKANTKDSAIILLLSDHGSRHLARKSPFYAYNNLQAIYLPSRSYESWYPALSNVNVFPLLFNTVFGLKVPLQKDSIVR
ncbi:sulfatase-like hydrolase/transferase [Flavitalea antarctica]